MKIITNKDRTKWAKGEKIDKIGGNFSEEKHTMYINTGLNKLKHQ